MKKSKINIKTIKQIDKSDMLGLLLDFPLQCKAAVDIANKAKILFSRPEDKFGSGIPPKAGENRDFNKIVFAGLGGSAIGADLVRSYLYFETKIPILVLREYEMPAYVDSSTLVFISSYSGNTEETLSAYADARKNNAVIIAVSSGGALKELAQKDNTTFIEIPKGLPPRCSLGYLSLIPLCVLARLGVAQDPSLFINQMASCLEDLRDNCLRLEIPQKDNIAKSIALKLCNKFGVIYSSSIHFDVCAMRLRGQIAENSKALTSSHLFPEMNHNEIVGWENPEKLFKNFVVIMLRDNKIYPRVALRMDITRDILKKQEALEVLEIWSRGEGLLSRIFSLIYIGDFISYYLAILYGIDPTPVDRVTYLKNKLAQQK